MQQFDPEDLSEILSNLLDNAGKWAAKKITIRFYEASKASIIEIEDDGDGVGPDVLDQIFEIGVSQCDRAGGSGLGLPISRDIARDYGGDITVANAPNGGLIAKIVLPLLR